MVFVSCTACHYEPSSRYFFPQEDKSHLTGESTQQSRAVEEAHTREKQELQQQIGTLREELTRSTTEKTSLLGQYSNLIERHRETEEQVTTLTGERLYCLHAV